MEWIADPTAWAGLATLIVLEIVLGIDNLIFIAILADKLPPEQRARARYVGLSLALFMRLGLLASISWVVTLTQPLVEVFGWSLSGRDLILLVGGLFLLFKATMELHERLEGHEARSETRVQHAVFWQVIVQIVVLDAVFSLDSVITAVGMVDHLVVMMIAVVVAVGVMMLAAKRLMDFVSAHPTVVILCLGFLMMIGFSLVAEGFGFHIPKGYLYAAIGFSVLIEMFNQFAHRNRKRLVRSSDLRERTAGAVLRMLGGSGRSAHAADEVAALVEQQEAGQIFAPEERSMIQGVLDLGDRPARSIMTPRPELSWLDVDTPAEEIERKILDQSHSRLLLARGSLDDLLGVALANDLLRDIAVGGAINLERSCRAPLIVHEGLNVLRLMERLRASPVQLAVVLDEYGSIEGVVMPADLLEAIAGEFPEEGEEAASLERAADGSWTVDASTDIRHLSGLIGVDLVDDDDKYSTLAGYLLWRLGRLPAVGERVQDPGFSFEIVSMQGRRIDQVRIRPSETEDALDARAEAGRRR